jgi:quercetin dioxygenase-like cupin family protein
MLSQLENGKLVPTLPTLARISMVFDVGVDYFFANKRARRRFSVVRANERIRFPDRADSPNPSFFFECLAYASPDKRFQAYLAEFPHRDPKEVPEHMHEGAEFLHVTEGKLEVNYQDESYVLRLGDSVYFDAAEPHSYRGTSKQAAKAIVVTMTPER